jgi:hypothetical protein
MSSSSFFNSPSYGNTFTLTNLAGAIALPVSSSATAFTPIAVITPVGGVGSLFKTIPAGKYAVTLICAVESSTAIVTNLNFLQLQLVDDTDVSYGISSSYGKNTSTVIANKPANTIYINDTIFINITTAKNFTLRLNYNIISGAGATVSANLASNPAVVCENQIIFREIL